MIISVMYILLTAIGLGFLIFIHELGHYYMGRRVGMKIEVFSIGFGKPLFTWDVDSIRWQICVIPFGGYVKFAGEQKEDGKEPYEIENGFFAKSPIDRIKVAFMGPFVNIVFAFLAFFSLWLMGGREKPFQEVTSYIGWLDPNSSLYADGIRPGDKIDSYDSRECTGARDHLYAAMVGDAHIDVKGWRKASNSYTQEPFHYVAKPYPHPNAISSDILTLGVLEPASFLIYDRRYGGMDISIQKGAPIEGSGIQYGDRVVWIDGQAIFSLTQFSRLINDNRVLLTVERGNELLHRRVSRLEIKEFKLDSKVKDEIEDWKYEAKIKSPLSKLYFIPYDLSLDCRVQGKLNFIDSEEGEKAFPEAAFSIKESPLELEDRIVAINGKRIEKSYEFLMELQEKSVHIIVERNSPSSEKISWEGEDSRFFNGVNWENVEVLGSSVGSAYPLYSLGKYHLLNPVVPVKRKDLSASSENKMRFDKALMRHEKELEEIEDLEKRSEALQAWEERQNQLVVGLPLQDCVVNYNPPPHSLFLNVFSDIWRTLDALVSGYLNPKWLSGPIGIVQIIHHGWTVGLKEAIFWLAVISLNLGILNLLPIPVLDGGYICLSIFEMITKVRLKAKTMERLILPFVVLLIAFFIFVTYQDVLRIFTRFFS